MGASHSHDTSVILLGQVVNVTAFYQISGGRGFEIPEIETVQADFGEITHILAMPSFRKFKWSDNSFSTYTNIDPSNRYRDPVQVAMFGRSQPWDADAPMKPVETTIGIVSPTWLEIIEAEITASETFRLICDEDPCEGLD